MSSSSRAVRRLRATSNMDELPFLFQEFGHAGFDIEIDQVDRVLQAFQKPAEKPVVSLRRTSSHGDVEIGAWAHPAHGHRPKHVHLRAALRLAHFHGSLHI